ncbi:MAG: mycothiol system anti-sigma-R factor [Sporichthyaceae bacterium]|nr:mycothiol system anti-sigma-R factor [Sporichthyaceae bacterium]
MSCGRPHEVPCSEILDQVYTYLDNEMPDPAESAKIKAHLDECSPCLDKFGLEKAVKALVHRSCGCDDVPGDLRDKVLERIRVARIELDAES